MKDTSNKPQKPQPQEATLSGGAHGQNQTVRDVLEQLRSSYEEVRREIAVFSSRPHKCADSVVDYVYRSFRSTAVALDRILSGSDVQLNDGFIQFNAEPQPAKIAADVDLKIGLTEDELEAVSSQVYEELIGWTRSVQGQDDLPDSIQTTLRNIVELQDRERTSLMDGLDSFRKG